MAIEFRAAVVVESLAAERFGREAPSVDKLASSTSIHKLRGVAQLGLERLVRDQEVAGSNPVAPTANFSEALG